MVSIKGADLIAIFSIIEKIGNEPSKGFLAFWPDRIPDASPIIFTLPVSAPDFPWRGRRVVAVPWPEATKRAVAISFDFQTVASQPGELIEPVLLKVPCFRAEGNAKKPTSIFSAKRYLTMSDELRTHLATIFPRDTERLLGRLLQNSARIGLSPVWAQSARFHKCPICRKPMRLIVQIDGMVFGRRFAEGLFYLFGCSRHPEELVQDEDWY